MLLSCSFFGAPAAIALPSSSIFWYMRKARPPYTQNNGYCDGKNHQKARMGSEEEGKSEGKSEGHSEGHSEGQRKARERWARSMEACVKSDVWGQVVEALEGYERLVADAVGAAADFRFDDADDQLLHDVVAVVKARCAVLACVDSESDRLTLGLSLSLDQTAFPRSDDMKLLGRGTLDELCSGAHSSQRRPFPLDVSRIKGHETRHWMNKEELRLSAQPVKAGGLLIPRPVQKPGASYITLDIQTVGIKDAEYFVSPLIRVSVLDRKGEAVEIRQETPVADKQQRYCVTFNMLVHIQTPLEELARRDAAVFLEFVHRKEKKKKDSTKCWAMLETDELTAHEPKVLELYKKPIAKSRKNVQLFSNKKLYMHVAVIQSSGVGG